MKHAVLVIEDDQWVASYVADVIRTFFGAAAFVATTPAAANELWSLNQSYIVAIIADITVPGGPCGIDLVQELVKQSPDMPVIFVTEDESDVSELSKSFGRAVGLLTKPFGPVELGRALKPIFDHAATNAVIAA